MTNIASGSAFMSLMPPRLLTSLSSSRWCDRASRLLIRSNVPSVAICSRSFRRLIDALTVLKLVSMPPSQRWSTNGMPARCASSATISRAWRLVPTKRMVPRLLASCRTYFMASWYICIVFSRLTMWILLRWPKM